MALEIGNYISDEMAMYINQWTETYEFNDIAKKHNLSDELARKLARGDRKVTSKNLPLITDIIALAISNRNQRFRSLQKTHKTALKLI